MSTEPGKPGALPTIRTFAADLDRVRHAREASKRTTQEKERPIRASKNTQLPNSEKPHRERRERKKRFRKPRPQPMTRPTDKAKNVASVPTVENSTKEVETIPPFHTIDTHKLPNKAPTTTPTIDTSEIEATQRQNAKPSVLESVSTRDIDINEEDASVGTIVSDVKRKRFRFFPAIFRSIRESFIELGAIVSGKDQQTYTIQKTERRKGVIQTATSRTGRFATGDHDQLVHRLRSRKQKRRTVVKKRPQDTLKKPERITDPEHLLEAPEPEPAEPQELPTTVRDHERKIVSVRIEPRKRQPLPHAVVPELTSVVPEKPVPVPVPLSTPPVVEKPVVPPEPESVVAEDAETVSSTILTPEPKATENASWSLSGLFNNQIAIEEEREGVTARETALSEEDVESLEDIEEERPLSESSLLAIGIVVALILLAGSFIFFKEMITNFIETRNEIVVIVPEPVIEGIPMQIVPIEIPSLATMLVRTKEIAQSTDSTIMIRPAYESAGVQTPLSSTQFINVLTVDLDAAFLSALDAFSLGATSDDTLFLAFTVRNTPDAYGGMLTWEQTLLRDVEQIFGTYVAATSTRTNQLSPFIDAVLADTDARVAPGENGTHLIYGIVDDRILIITSTEPAYEMLVSFIRTHRGE